MSLIVAKTSTVQSAVLSGTLHMPLQGVPTYDIVIDVTDGAGFDAGTAVTISCDGGITLSGTVTDQRTGDFLDTMHVRITGGKYGMWKPATARGYMQPSAYVKDVVNGLLKDAGESLSSTSDQSLLNTNLQAWMTTTRPVSANLDVLLGFVAPSAGWRILADGTVWIGTDSFSTTDTSQYVRLIHDPADGHYELGVDVPAIVPGVNVQGDGTAPVGNAAIVEHRIKKDEIRTFAWSQMDADRGEAAAVSDIADHVTASFDFARIYDVTVKSQSADLLTVDVNPPEGLTKIGGLQRVPILQPFPQCKVQVPNGVTVRLGWNRGDPRYPYVSLFGSGDSVTRIQLGGNTDAARKGDGVGNGTLAFTFGAGSGAATLAITYTPGDGSAPQVLAAGSGTLTIKEKIVAGSSIVGLG